MMRRQNSCLVLENYNDEHSFRPSDEVCNNEGKIVDKNTNKISNSGRNTLIVLTMGTTCSMFQLNRPMKTTCLFFITMRSTKKSNWRQYFIFQQYFERMHYEVQKTRTMLSHHLLQCYDIFKAIKEF